MGLSRRLCRFLLTVGAPVVLSAQTVEEGIALYQKNNFAEAKKVFEAVLKNDGKNAEVHYRLGILNLNRNFKERNVDEAADHLEEATDLNPNNADYQYSYGAAVGEKAQNSGFIKQGFLAPKIKSAFQRAVELNPNHIQARLGLAQYYMAAPGIMGGDSEKGWKEIDAAIGLDEAVGRRSKANFLEREKKIAEAENEWKTLVTKFSRDWRSWKGQGYFYLRNNRVDEALSSMNKYLELRPDTSDAYDSVAEVWLQKKDADQSMNYVKKALDLDPESSAAVYLMAKTYELKGQKKEARESYEKVMTMNINEFRRKEIEKKLKELNN